MLEGGVDARIERDVIGPFTPGGMRSKQCWARGIARLFDAQ